MATVSLRGLTKNFTGMAAVDDLSLDIGDGEFVSLLGPSGCGKTTTLRLLAGFLQPDGGEIVVNGSVVSSPALLVPPERRNMSMIFQSYAVWPHMTVAQNVAYGLKFKNTTRQEADQKVTRLLRLVHLEALKERYPGELSGGQQQRVALARALVVEPQILLMDEPLSNLDANLREEMRFEIRRLHEEFGITTIYVTHDQGEAMATSDRIAVLNKGRMAQVGEPAEIFDQPRTRFVAEFVGKANILSGRWCGEGKIQLGNELMLAVVQDGLLNDSKDVSVCLRPHHIVLTADESVARQLALTGHNVFSGIVERRVYFGESIDYTVDLAPQPIKLRVVSSTGQNFSAGQRVFASAQAEHCVVVKEE
jgi:iron(III) transport system ATP-binding protein